MGFSLQWLLLLQSTGSRYAGFSSCASQAPECRLSSCGTWAQLLCGMWDLPGPELKAASPSLAGRFLTTAPPGKSWKFLLTYLKDYSIIPPTCLVYCWAHQRHSSFTIVFLISSIFFWFFIGISISLLTLPICNHICLKFLVWYYHNLCHSKSDSHTFSVSSSCVFCLLVWLIIILLKANHYVPDKRNWKLLQWLFVLLDFCQLSVSFCVSLKFGEQQFSVLPHLW